MSRALHIETAAGPAILDARKVLYLPAHDALLLGDVHFEKASFLQASGGHPLPAFDTHDNLNRLEALLTQIRPRTLIALGDSFHDVRAGERLSSSDHERINALASQTDLIWVLGNHDPDIPSGLAGAREDHVQLGDWLLTHHPHDPGEGGVNICGHLHPKARISVRGRRLSGPCFAVSEQRIIVPSFGTYTGGLWVSDPAIAREMDRDARYYLISRGVIAPLAADRVA